MTKVAEFSISHHQYLDHQGQPTQALPEFANKPENLIELYTQMVQLRAYDKKAIALQRTGKMGTYASTLGQEAISVAVGHCMQQEDVLCPFYRDYGAQLQRGIAMHEVYSYWGGDERGSNYENNKEDMPICVPIASQCLHASGIATAFKLRKQPRVAVTTIGEGGTSEGDFYEAMNVAGDWKLPVVFVINNNQWAISVPRKAQTACETIAQKAIAAGFEGVQVDGNDIIAMCDVMLQALDKARNGGGPTLIEAITYRLCDHTTADDASRYRDQDEVDTAKQYEPVIRLQKYMHQQGYWDKSKETELLAQCNKNVETQVETYFNKDKAPITDMFDYHYAELPDNLIEQRQQAVEEAQNA